MAGVTSPVAGKGCSEFSLSCFHHRPRCFREDRRAKKRKESLSSRAFGSSLEANLAGSSKTGAPLASLWAEGCVGL